MNVHKNKDIVRCLSVEQLTPSVSHKIKIKARAQKVNPEFTVVYTEARHHENLVTTLFIYSLINWVLKPCTMLFKLKGISQVMQSL